MALYQSGKALFNIAHAPLGKSCIAALLRSAFTTEYDKRLAEATTTLRESSKALLAELHTNPANIPKLIDNAITNLCLLTLTRDKRPATKQEAQRNYCFHMSLAKNASDTGDDNSAILIRSALLSNSVDRLTLGKKGKRPVLKKRKRHLKLLEQLAEKYGTFKNCHSTHLKHVLDNFDVDSENGTLPSAMVLDIHRKRTREHAKAFATIGKMPKSLLVIEGQLGRIIDNLKFHGRLIGLYSQQPTHPCIDTENLQSSMFSLSRQVATQKRVTV